MYQFNITPSQVVPTAPGAIIGYRKDRRPIRLIGGGAPDGAGDGGDGSSGGDAGNAGDGGGTGGTGTGDNDGGTGGDDKGGTDKGGTDQGSEGDVASLPAWAQKAIKDARADAAKSRTTAKQKAAQDAESALVQKLGKALGLVKDDEQVDPAKLTEQLTQSQEDAAAAQIELTVYRTAMRLGADADQLLDSRKFCEEVDALDADPNDAPAFRTAVEQLIKDTLKKNPKLTASQAPGRSGGDLSGGPGGGTSKPKSLDDAIAKAYGG